MNSATLQCYFESNDDAGLIEVFEPDSDGDMAIALLDVRGKHLADTYLSPTNARELAMLLLRAAEFKL